MPLMDQTHWASALQSSIRWWALTDGGQQEALLQAVMSCYGRAAANRWFWRRITSSVFLEAAIQDLEAHYGQGRECLDQLLAWVIGAMGEVGVIRKTTGPGVLLIDYPYREKQSASPWH